MRNPFAPFEMIPPIRADFDATTGRFPQATGHYQKTLDDLEGLYHDQDAFAAMLLEGRGRVVYEVWEHRASKDSGDLVFGTSVMQPGRVGCEFFLTRGHQHLIADRAETYYCLSGSGLVLMESPEGESKVLEQIPGQLVYVPPRWIHRSINTGDSVLTTLFCYNADAGQDYEIIRQRGGMRKLIVTDGSGGWALEDNPNYVSPA